MILCNVQRDIPNKNNARQFEKLQLESRGFRSAIYIHVPPFSHSPGNGKPHLHIMTFTNVTLLFSPRSFDPKFCLGDTWVRQLWSGSCHLGSHRPYSRVTQTLIPPLPPNVTCKEATPARTMSINSKSLSLNQGMFVPYIPPFSHSPGNGKPHLHVMTFTNITIVLQTWVLYAKLCHL